MVNAKTVQLGNRFFLPIFALMLMLYMASAHAANLSAYVDRTTVTQGDTLQLVVEIDDNNVSGEPDFSGLEKNFQILGTQRASNTSIVNGQVSAKTSWILDLMPKRTGYLMIQPITFQGQSTDPITVKVEKANANLSANTSKPIFVRTSVDKASAYVQEQIVLSIKIFYRARLVDAKNPTFNIDGAAHEQLGDNTQYSTQINGYRYEVIEIKHLIFPQKVGNLEIPSITFEGAVDTSQNRSLFSFGHGRRVVESAPPINVEIKDIPDSYPAGAPWIPANQVTIQEEWKPENPQFKVGEAVTRTVYISATNQSSSILPDLPDISSDEYKVYPDQAVTDEKKNNQGIVGYRAESVAIVPTKPGHFTLPAISLYWWNTTTNKLEKAQLPSKEIQVLPAEKPANTLPNLPAPAKAPQTTIDVDTPQPQVVTVEGIQPYWKVLAIVFALLWLVTLALLIVQYFRRPRIVQKKSNTASRPPVESTRNLWAKLRDACKENDPVLAKVALINLVQRLSSRSILHLGDIKSAFPEQEDLLKAISNLELALYKEAQIDWQGNELLVAIADLKKALNEKKGSQDPKGDLEPLYPV